MDRLLEGVSALKKLAITGGPAVTFGRPGGTACGRTGAPTVRDQSDLDLVAAGLMRKGTGKLPASF